MRKLFIISFASFTLVFGSCNSSSTATPNTKDSGAAAGPDSVANNRIIPPSAAPDNATNSSLADTSYKAKDSTKKK